MNNVRDAPPQPETFPKEQERAPVAGSIPPGGGGGTRRCRGRHRAPSPPQNQTLLPLRALGLAVLSAGESASSSSQLGGGQSPGNRLSPQSQTVAPRERRQFCRAQGMCRPGTGARPRGTPQKRNPTPDQIPQPCWEAERSQEPTWVPPTPRHATPRTSHVHAGCHACPHTAGEGVCLCHTCAPRRCWQRVCTHTCPGAG